jgi:thymidine phosphorylase
MILKENNKLKARLLGIDTHSEAMVFLRKDSPVCRSEGFTSHNRVQLKAGSVSVIATLYQVESDFLAPDEAGLSDVAWRRLAVNSGDIVAVRHAPPLESLALVRSRIFGHALDQESLERVVTDIVAERYSAIEIAAFLTACAADPMALPEIEALTRAMVDAGDRISWNRAIIADKHSVGGLPGNRTTPIIVAIVTSLGLTMPKTSSRAITSPAGTADTMETLAPVNLDVPHLRRVVQQEGGCIAWGGAMRLSPADDILIRVERALDIDSEGQMIASVLSKKVAAGATHLVIDMPVGPTAKVRSRETAAALSAGLESVARSFGIRAKIVIGDGRQPIGHGMGPALEARDVLKVLQCAPDAPLDLRDRAVELSGALLELCGRAAEGDGRAMAAGALDDASAWAKFQRICEAQGGMRTPPLSRFRQVLTAEAAGILTGIDNRRIARLAKLAGAPHDKAAGVELHVRLGAKLESGAPLCTVHAETEGELAYALSYANANRDLFSVRDHA